MTKIHSRKRRLDANQTKLVGFTVHMEPDPTDSSSFTTNFIVPFYAISTGYGPCFKPISGEIVVNVIRQPRYVPSKDFFFLFWEKGWDEKREGVVFVY